MVATNPVQLTMTVLSLILRLIQSLLKEQHRKNTAFEMESFALYEAARLSVSQPRFFSAKTVVDDGTETKGDHFHRIGCILSAKVVHELISRGL
jgi:hypothetical protein